jgi:hypothetical protein
MTIQELKARAYDLLVFIEQANQELRQVNDAINKAIAEQAKEDNKNTTKETTKPPK